LFSLYWYSTILDYNHLYNTSARCFHYNLHYNASDSHNSYKNKLLIINSKGSFKSECVLIKRSFLSVKMRYLPF
jgi:hypothetical protein